MSPIGKTDAPEIKKIAELGLIAVIQVEAKYFSTIEFSLYHYKL